MTPYDTWRLTPPDAERSEVGTEDGQPCLRYPETDEDAPRGYRSKPCQGEMVEEGGVIMCDRCMEVIE